MWPLLVVVIDVGTQNPVEVAIACDQQPVEAFGSHGPDPALGDRVGSGRSDRRLDDLDAFGREDLVEGSGELAISVVNEETNGAGSLIERETQIAGLLDDPGRVGVGGAACQWTRRVESSMKNKTYTTPPDSV
jgi:hypothetical protein